VIRNPPSSVLALADDAVFVCQRRIAFADRDNVAADLLVEFHHAGQTADAVAHDHVREKQRERLVANDITGAPDRVPEAKRGLLTGKAGGARRGSMSSSDFSSTVLPRARRVASSSGWMSKWSSMTDLLRPVTKTKCSIPASMASSTTYCTTGLSTTVSISLGTALVAGRNRSPILQQAEPLF
jgi:hypothetical protein